MNERSAGKDPANSPDGLAAFQTYANLINSERETLWARHNALVLANSLIIGALAISPAALWENKWAALAMLGAGLVICAAWFLMTVLAWSAMRRHCDSPRHLPHLVSRTFPVLSRKPSAIASRGGSIASPFW
jgi:fatty acid desaturase